MGNTTESHDLNTPTSLENAMAQQYYLEMLSFEAHSLHEWSSTIAEQIIAESEQAHHQLARILDGLAAQQKVNAWTRNGAETYGLTSPTSAVGFNADDEAASKLNAAGQARPSVKGAWS